MSIKDSLSLIRLEGHSSHLGVIELDGVFESVAVFRPLGVIRAPAPDMSLKLWGVI